MQEQDDERSVGQPQRPHPLNQRTYQSMIDQQFVQAEAAGQFANLPGQGQPLDLGDDSHVPDDDRLGYRMLKNGGFSLPWIEALRDIDDERRRIDGWLSHANDRWPHLDAGGRAKLQAEFHAKLEALRSQLLTYNLRAPASVSQQRSLDIARELQRLGGE